jgi:N-acetylneuraminate synthase
MPDPKRTFVIAEAGSNHNGDMDTARRLIEVAAEAGADAVKFQVFRARTMYPRSAGVSDYLGLPTPIYDVIEEMETPYEWLPVLAEECRAASLEFMATPFDEEAADRIDPFVGVHKIASYELTHLPLVEHVARKAKPLILSTGAADLDDVGEAVAAIEAAGCSELTLMQCTAAYPAPFESLELRAMRSMREAFGLPVGLSDHSRHPLVAPVAAVALGAAAIEKHFTLSNDLPGPDHRFAVEPDELKAMVQAIRDTERALGDGRKATGAAERELHAFARRALFATRRIPAGEPFTAANVAALRCGKLDHGLPPRDLPSVLGRRAARDLDPDSPVLASDVA